MRRSLLIVLAICLGIGTLTAQDLDSIQLHGFVTQGFLFSSNNNYISLKSSEGGLQLTDGAISLNDSLSDKLRVGIQLHMYQLGEFGGSMCRLTGPRATSAPATISEFAAAKSKALSVWSTISRRGCSPCMGAPAGGLLCAR